jgi:hypothetical protein
VRVTFTTTIAIPHRPRHLAASASPSPATSRIAIDIMLRISRSTRGHLPLYQSALLKHLAQSLHPAAHKHCTYVTHRGCIIASGRSIFLQHPYIKRELSRSAIAGISAIHRCEHYFERRQPLGVHHTHHSVASYALAAQLMSPQQSESSSTAQADPSRAPASFQPQPLAPTK